MKITKVSDIETLRRKYSDDLIQLIVYCRDEIRGLKFSQIDSGYDEAEVEETIGDELDEIYEAYFKDAQETYGISEPEFDYIYQYFEELDP